jgi:hypothetical protein
MSDAAIPPAPTTADEAAAEWARKMTEAGADPASVGRR